METTLLIAGNVTAVVGGFFAIFNLVDKRTKVRNQERIDLEESVRELYQEKIKEQDKKIESLNRHFHDLNGRYIILESKNEALNEVFQGRDADVVTYRKEGRKSRAVVNAMAKSILSNGKKTDAILISVNRLATAIEGHLSKAEIKNTKRGRNVRSSRGSKTS